MTHPTAGLCPAVFLVFLFNTSPSNSAEKADSVKSRGKVSTNDDYNWFTINNIFNWYGNNGNSSYNIATANSGLEFPKGSGKTAIFEDGVVWGGFHKGRVDPKVGGDAYRYGLQAGAILTFGGPTEAERAVADNPSLAKYRVYKVRPDVSLTTSYDAVKSEMESEADLINRYSPMTGQALFAHYQQDWAEWPAKDGLPAPYKDVDSDGKYDPAIDVPGQPGADQTLYYVANDLDPTRASNFASSPPVGLELHRTVWGYKLAGPIGNIVYSSTLLINKSGGGLDSAFLGQWSDPDIGSAASDYAGCDVARAIGYVYNGPSADPVYGIATPAAGYALLQGALVRTGIPSDSTLFRQKYRVGYKNLGMCAFVADAIPFFSPYLDPWFPGQALSWYYLMSGLDARYGTPIIDPTTGALTKFVLSGDPLTGLGWIDGTYGWVPRDQRILLSTGPFSLANQDTQELVIATIAAQGGDRLSSVAILRWQSEIARGHYESIFRMPQAPPNPHVRASAIDQSIVLTWTDTVAGIEIERWESSGYRFEGYNVYQFKDTSADLSHAVRHATYDLTDGVANIFDDVLDAASGVLIRKLIQEGKDSGIFHKHQIDRDALTGLPFHQGTPYYFGVTAYAYNSSPIVKPKCLESAPRILTVVPESQPPGLRYAAGRGDTLQVEHSGPGDGGVQAVVVDPTALPRRGAEYLVTFEERASSIWWNLVRISNGVRDTVARNELLQTAPNEEAAIRDGIEWRIWTASLGFKSFLTLANSSGPIVPAQQSAFAFAGSGFPTTDGRDPDGTNDRPDGTVQQSGGTLRTSQGWGIHTGMYSPDMSPTFANFTYRVTQGGARWSLIGTQDFEIRFTATGGKALVPSTFGSRRDALIDVPFELWNIGSATPIDTTDDYRMFPNILDVDGNFQINLLTQGGVDTVDVGSGVGTADHSISDGNDDPFTDWIYWVLPADRSPGQAGYNAVVAGAEASIAANQDAYLGPGTAGTDVFRRMVLVGWNFGSVAGGAYPQQMPESGTVFRISTLKANTPVDTFTVTVPPRVENRALALADVNLINVFPNPYLGLVPGGSEIERRSVVFSHLPQRVTIRIFTLSGILTRTFVKDDPSQFVRWDLKNEKGSYVAPGMYIAYVEVLDLGVRRILKLAVWPGM
ncbi:MAG: hypothetical protein AB1428_11270 [Bacteroidota bacterium]